MRIVFLHPDMGIGGAERLVVDAALALKAKSHHVSIFTAHHDRSHSFKETRDGTIDVTVAGENIFLLLSLLEFPFQFEFSQVIGYQEVLPGDVAPFARIFG